FNLLNEIKNVNFLTFNELLENIHQIYELSREYSYSNKIFENYFKIITPYLLYHFNDIKLKDETKKVNKIKEIFINQVERIVDDYKMCLKRII
ncbi:hypothetical protein ACN4FT_11125, partial [Aliarcobacter butzleri]